MSEIKSMFLLLTVITISLSILNFMTTDENKSNTFKGICIVFIIYIMISSAFKIDIKDKLLFDIKKYNNFKSQTYDIESEIIKLSENNLKDKLCDVLSANSIKFSDLECRLEYKNNEIANINVTIHNCAQKNKAENLINNFFEENGGVNVEFE